MSTGACIYGIGMSVPERSVSNEELSRTIDTSDEWIRQRTGIAARRVAADGEATSTLAIEACRRALKAAETEADEIDLLLLSTVTPDYLVPGASPLVQAALGATRAGSLDINAGCCGFVTGLSLATAMVTSGQARRVLVCGAETLSRILDWTDRVTAVLFGDGAGAAVVGVSDRPRLGPFVLGADGTKVDWLWQPAGGSRMPATEKTVADRAHTIKMRGQDVYKAAVEKMTEAARTILGEEPVSSVDLVVAHQANARIIQAVADRLGLTEDQTVCTMAQYGNTSAASIPIALTELEASGRLREGMRVLLAAFGAGVYWGAGMVTWGR